jgi:hypothetical protein
MLELLRRKSAAGGAPSPSEAASTTTAPASACMPRGAVATACRLPLPTGLFRLAAGASCFYGRDAGGTGMRSS